MRLLMTTVSALVIATAPAFAQGAPTDTTQKMNQTAAKSFQFVREQAPNQWSAEALIGRTVYNLENDELGDINNVILTEDGRVAAVTIGVGGFLGVGEKDVGVPFSALSFRPADRAGMAGRTEQQTGATNPSPQQPRGQADTGDNKSAMNRGAANDRAASNDRAMGEQGNMRIYLNSNKDQLKDAPAFRWLDDRS